MKKQILIVLSILALSTNAFAQRRARPVDRPKLPLSATHLLPTALVLPNGALILGTVSGVGLLDIFDITTNLYLDISQVLNVNLKANLYKSEDIALATYVSVVSQTVRFTRIINNFSEQISEPSTAISPGVVFSYRIAPQIVGHVGGRIAIRNPTVTKADLGNARTGFVQGNTINKEFSYGINSNVALSVGGTYDLTYEVAGAGASVHVGGFQIGAHYYFNVTEGAVLPIVGGSYTARLD